MKRNIFLTLALVILVVLAVARHRYLNRERLFLDDAFTELRHGGGSPLKLESGASASVILEHSCCSGAGFDAVAVRTSDGQEFYSKNNYCGLGGFFFELEEAAVQDLPRFTAFLRAHGYEELKTGKVPLP